MKNWKSGYLHTSFGEKAIFNRVQKPMHHFLKAVSYKKRMRVLQKSSKTLGRQPNNNNINGLHTVMPNPDDILPKEAWTDFSGNDEWPRFSRIASAASAYDRNSSPQRLAPASTASAAATVASVTDNNNSSTRLYVNCPANSSSSGSVSGSQNVHHREDRGGGHRGLIPDSKDLSSEDQDAANGNCENSLSDTTTSALNGLRPLAPSVIAPTTSKMTSSSTIAMATSPTRLTRPPPRRKTTAVDNDNRGQEQTQSWNEKFSQQIENNLMASVSHGGQDSSKKVIGLATPHPPPLDSAASAAPSEASGTCQGHVRSGTSEMRSKPPVPPPRNCISHHQRKTRTKKQQSTGNEASPGLHYLASEEAIDETAAEAAAVAASAGQGNFSLRGHHANDEKTSSSNEEDHSSLSSASLEPEASEDELDNDLEKSLLFQPNDLGSSEWHQSPLLHQ